MNKFETNYRLKRRIVYAFVIFILTIYLAETVFAFGIAVDTEPRYGDDYGWFFYMNFPYNQDVIGFINLLGIVDNIWVDDEQHTWIDVNDGDYLLNRDVRNQQIDQLTFLQWFNYIHYAYRFVSPLEAVYMRGYNQTGFVEVVECKPIDLNSDHIYEIICTRAT